ncbi:Glycerol-3-phosphate ABC transporter, permease protein UgpA [Rhodococcus wratislaviensis]|uniref:Glycerol-3-phosphate ABC transporter, permease protein UgpA n=1 Tax=Rhodococcus wratislaviensis TaxID=44752 RepID=A0A402CH29_RHOWR|nr:sugar ABC transporter permease [Rhodococcus wratislaviensis]GCE42885.1 Glycerol-3-phosphate ABC transporter, permease protein UgpA [Rhodococcus wratislaviensis]
MFAEVPAAAAPVTPSGTDRAATVRPSRTGRVVRRLTPYLYLLPAVVLLIVWIYKPLAETVGLSFYKWNMVPTSPKTPVGLDNYTRVLALPELHQALRNTVVYVLAFMVFSLLLPVVVALLSNRVSGRAKTVYQALIFVPFLVTPVAGSAIWRWLFNPDGGTIPRVAATLGFELGNVFREPSLALAGVVLIVGWQMLGFGVLVISAGLAGISPDYASAAALDGASQATITRRIILPLLSPTLVFLGLMTILLGAQWAYPIIDIVTQGGPSGASTNIYYLLYQFGFQNFDAGLSAAAGTLFFLGFGLIAIVFVRLSDRLSFYDN